MVSQTSLAGHFITPLLISPVHRKLANSLPHERKITRPLLNMLESLKDDAKYQL